MSTSVDAELTASGREVIERIMEILATVPDPEIPVISVLDLGLVRAVTETPDGFEISVTPTYAGCPATAVIAHDIRAALEAAGISARLVTRLSPPWTTDWITPAGRAQLQAYGIAPPGPADHAAPQVLHFTPRRTQVSSPACPLCASVHTLLLSQFGSTPCKALYRCLDCREPFDYFKPL